MQFPVLDMNGKQVNTIDLPADIFEVPVNVGLMHQAFVRQMANARLGTHATQRRMDMKTSTIKMYRQKGTGRARHGSRSATQFVGGGRPMGPQPRSHAKDMPKKMRRKAIRCALSALARDQQLIFVDQLTLDTPKTKEMLAILQRVAGEGVKTLVLITDAHENVQRSMSNLEKATALRANYLNLRDLLQAEKVVVPRDALEVIKQIWGLEKK